MRPPVEQGCLTLEQAVERLRGRVVSELRLLNEHLSRSRRLERGEIDRLVDNLLSAVRETPRRRNASLLEKAVWMVGGVLIHRIRRRNQRRIDDSLIHRAGGSHTTEPSIANSNDKR